MYANRWLVAGARALLVSVQNHPSSGTPQRVLCALRLVFVRMMIRLHVEGVHLLLAALWFWRAYLYLESSN